MDRRNRLFSPRFWRGCACLALLLALPVGSEAGLFRHKVGKRSDGRSASAQPLGLVVEPLSDGVRLQIDCSAPVRFQWGLLEQPRGLYIDVDNAQIARALRSLAVGVAGLTDLRSEPRGPDQVRLSLGLREGVTPHVERSQNGCSLSIELRGPGSIEAPTPEPRPEPLPAHEKAIQLPRHPEALPDLSAERAPVKGAGASLTGLSVENLSAAEALVHVRLSGEPGSPRSFRLNDPPRLVLDLPGAQNGVTTSPRFTGTGPLSLGSVWSAQFSLQPPVARVVIRLPQRWTPFSVEPRDPSGELRVKIGSAAAATARPAAPAAGPAFGRGLVIGIDPGHGGSDPGAMNPALGVYEKNITLDIACRLARLLEQSGARVTMTRRDDRRLEQTQRIAFVSRGEADVVVSIHCDAIEGRPNWTGITTYFHGSNPRGHELASALQSLLPGATGLPDRGVRSDMSRYQHGFYVLRDARMPAVLIECGYVSDSATARKMRRPEFRQKVAQGIAEGLRKYCEDRAPRPWSASLVREARTK